jgi:hypothetical protein
VLTPAERKELERRARSRSLASELVKRAKVILMLADGHSYSEVRRKIACTDRYISGWKLRFQLERLAGLDSRYRGAEYIAWPRSLEPVNRPSVGSGGNWGFNPIAPAAT